MTDLTSSTTLAHSCEYYTPHQQPGGSYRDAPSDISVIVTAHNSAAFLHDCMKSIMSQSLQPEKIVIVDDHSKEDNTLAIAHAYEQHGVHVLRTPENLGMCGARLLGLAETNSPVVMFFDGDDMMPPDALKTMRAELGSNGFIYPGRRLFRGNEVTARPAPPADRGNLWAANYCPSPSLMWRHVYEAAGGWQKPNPEGTLPDWELFLRMSGIASFAPSEVKMLIRRHDRNFSQTKWDRPISEIYGDTRVHAATITVGMVYSGRLGNDFLSRWLSHVASSLKHAGKKAQLLILDDSPEGIVLQTHHPVFTSVSVERMNRNRSAKLTPHQVSRMLASAYNRLMRDASGDLLWMIEDDILVSQNAAKDLINAILRDPGSPKPAACGCYRSRHHPDQFILADYDGRSVLHARRLPDGPTPVRLTGTGCMMVLRDLVKDVAFEPQWHCGTVRSNAHDWTFSSQLFDRKTPIIALPQVLCPHFQSEHAFV